MRTAAIVRILTGAMLIALGWGKAAGDFVKTGFAESTRSMAAETWPFWRHFLEKVVLPQAGLFAWLVVAGELAVGIGLVLGLFTRIAAAGGALLMLSVLLGTARPASGAEWHEWITAGLTVKFCLLLLVLILATDPGRVWGLDGRMGRRKPVRG